MCRLRSLLIPGVDKQLLVGDAARGMPDLARRRFIAGGASFGALTLLTGCNVSDSFSAEEMLKQISKFNDGVQAAIFNPYALAPTFPESAITKPFPFNAYYEVDADTSAKYCWFQCADKDGYNSPLDMETALHPQTQMSFKFADEILPRAYGYPMKIRVPTKLGFKNPKYVISMEVTNDYKGGYWEDQGYNSFSGN